MNTSLKDIFNSNYSSLCNYAYTLIKDQHQAKDLVQTVFIQLWENNKLLELDNPAPYLLKCVKYKCLDYLKHPDRKRAIYTASLPELSVDEDQQLQEADILPMLHYFADSLPSKMKVIFLMSRNQGMTYKEIAEELKISIKTVENQMSNALKKLRVLLQEHHYLPALLILINNFIFPL